jgi:hypothetical protein
VQSLSVRKRLGRPKREKLVAAGIVLSTVQ